MNENNIIGAKVFIKRNGSETWEEIGAIKSMYLPLTSHFKNTVKRSKKVILHTLYFIKKFKLN